MIQDGMMAENDLVEKEINSKMDPLQILEPREETDEKQKDVDNDLSRKVVALPVAIGQDNWPYGQREALSRIRKSWMNLKLTKRGIN